MKAYPQPGRARARFRLVAQVPMYIVRDESCNHGSMRFQLRSGFWISAT